ncbi:MULTISPECIES: acetylglutamate kinase [Hyphomicrobiales]|jgi:acetylglutamate kinase|uniref:Acetylglutamate kinase n=2 Tax=Prosthecodimorpha TaxID=2981530 RepID=A0A0P6VMA5_9HYPH|nr:MULTISPECIES: acetylglutamate kinase [Hyphomicrobiales]KPL53799.1 acetylglutamate kinase [Prosthecomicrobium hirschii]MBT9293053.1 acetylglutamate kinase [Prosthecodimorpha staleyi]MCW1841307.1 acetylglutamate kinase [Prosthecomicrobium hirschii]TPQ50532.1 acetylglutamate kinase [Prosthecomicrobium hirschii]
MTAETPVKSEAELVAEAEILSKALPYMLRYDDKTVVVKYGGHAMGDPALGRAFAEDITLLKLAGVNPVVVHGGGPQINAMLDRLGIKSEFAGGMRVTDKATVEVVEMVLAGSINKDIVQTIGEAGGRAIGLTGKDGNMVTATKIRRTVIDPATKVETEVDMGFVGDPQIVRTEVLDVMKKSEIIPVLAPICPGENGETYNVNADTFAGAIAGALGAARLLFLTDVPGVLDKDKRLIKELTRAEAQRLIEDGTISGGMIPKVETCLEALDRGVEAVVILNGKVAHAVLLELFTEHGAGTLITR